MAGDVTMVLVHGACCGAWGWEPLGKELDARGIRHVAVDLPSVGVGVDPNTSFHADAKHLRAVLDGVHGPVVLCGNSYGGIVITEASAGAANVVRLVYVAAFMPDAEDDPATWMFAHCTPEVMSAGILREDGLIEPDLDLVRPLSFQQATPEVADWALGQMGPMAMGAGSPPSVTGVGWRDIPSTYIVCSEDGTIKPESQRQWARERATDSIEVPFDHVAPLSHPAEIADILAKIVEDASPSTT
jgi:pimeloyl-ACP methyl ester carboxylesterase